MTRRFSRTFRFVVVAEGMLPVGASMLLACKDFDGYSLYLLEPSGECQRYFGNAVGKGRQAAKNEIEKLKMAEMTCEVGGGDVRGATRPATSQAPLTLYDTKSRVF